MRQSAVEPSCSMLTLGGGWITALSGAAAKRPFCMAPQMFGVATTSHRIQCWLTSGSVSGRGRCHDTTDIQRTRGCTTRVDNNAAEACKKSESLQTSAPGCAYELGEEAQRLHRSAGCACGRAITRVGVNHKRTPQQGSVHTNVPCT